MIKQYRASIKNDTEGTWIESMDLNSYTHTLRKRERRIFKNKKRAETMLKILQSKHPDTFTIIIET